MPPRSSAGKTTARSTHAPENVETFLDSLDHPFKQEILELRRIILAADEAIGEEIKWNAPSFRTTEHFATMQLRANNGVMVILHLGAKKRANAPVISIADPGALLTWLGEDRASLTFRDIRDIEANAAHFTDILRQWISYV